MDHTATMCGTMRVASSRWDPRSFIFPLLLPLLRSLISVIEHRTRTRSQCSPRSVHARKGTRAFLCVRDSTSFHPLFFAPPPRLSPMYANPVYELAKCTHKCIRRAINCRSSLEQVLRKLFASWAKLSQPRLRILSISRCGMIRSFLKALSDSKNCSFECRHCKHTKAKRGRDEHDRPSIPSPPPMKWRRTL